MFVSIFLFCFTMTGFSQSLGDVNESGETDIVDALLVAQYYVGLNIPGFISEVADVDCSGEIDIVDALLVAQYYVGLVSELSCGSVTPVPTDGSGARRPFPQNIKYPYGFIPTTIDSDYLKSEYERWIATAFTTCSDTMNYVTCDNHGISPSPTTGKAEAIGFGMWTFAFMGEKERFDALYNFYKINCNDGIAGGMMGWLGTCNGNDYGMATDG